MRRVGFPAKCSCRRGLRPLRKTWIASASPKSVNMERRSSNSAMYDDTDPVCLRLYNRERAKNLAFGLSKRLMRHSLKWIQTSTPSGVSGRLLAHRLALSRKSNSVATTRWLLVAFRAVKYNSSLLSQSWTFSPFVPEKVDRGTLLRTVSKKRVLLDIVGLAEDNTNRQDRGIEQEASRKKLPLLPCNKLVVTWENDDNNWGTRWTKRNEFL